MSNENTRIGNMFASVNVVNEKDFSLREGVTLADCFGDRLKMGDSFVQGLWDTPDLFAFFKKLNTNPKVLFRVLGPASERGVVEQSVEKTAQHYNIGNNFYESILGPRMQYTSGIWPAGCTDLTKAQERKLNKLFMKLGLNSGDRLLDIGGGWGGLAELFASKYGIEVHVITIVEEQMLYGRKSCNGLPVHYHLLDYRAMSRDHFDGKSFDAVVTVEMMEHVGLPEQHVIFHQKVADVLKPNAVVVHQVMSSVKPVVDQWLHERIFPEGVLLTLLELKDSSSRGGFDLEDDEVLGKHYPPTLLAWRENLFANQQLLTKVGYTKEVFRTFDYYFSLCAVLFQTGLIDLHQLILRRRG